MFARSPAAVTARLLVVVAMWGTSACSTSTPNGAAGAVDCVKFPQNLACTGGNADVVIGTGADGSNHGDSAGVDDGQTTTDEDGTVTPVDSGGNAGDATPGTDVKIGPGPGAAKYAGYASRELHVRIVGPSGRGHATVAGSIAEVAGVLFGNADVIRWKNLDNSAEGNCYGAPFFQSDPISLVQGDNHIVVTATNKTETATDTLTITFNSTFSFQDRLRMNPSVVKKGKAGTVSAQIAIGKAGTVVPGSIKLVKVDATGGMSPLGAMNDDGVIATSGDEIKSDGIYTVKVNVTTANAGSQLYRVQLQYDVGGTKNVAFSDIANVEVVEDLTASECNGAVAALQEATDAGKAAGGGEAGQQAALDKLKANAAVDSAGPASADVGGKGAGAWVRFKNGTLGAVDLGGNDGNRGDGTGGAGEPGVSGEDLALTTVQVQSKRALLLDPFAKTLGADEIATAGDQMAKLQCPAYTVDAYKDGAADLHRFRHMYEYGVVALAGHGDAYFKDLPADVKADYGWQHTGSQEVLWTGHAIQCSYFGSAGAPAKTCQAGTNANPAGTPCGPESECLINGVGGTGICVDHLTADLRRGRVVLGSGGTYGITPAFFKKHADQAFPRSLVYLGACRTAWNGTLAGELFAAGAAAVLGYTGYVSNDFATKWGATFFDNLIGQKQLSGVAHVQIEDAKNPGTYFNLVGAQNLDAAYTDILNPSFESGNIQGWLKNGDGRVISQLGSTGPVAGKFMAIVSTGLGFTTENGELKQTFCVPAGKTQFSFWWKFYSEEFKEFCGSTYQDQFLAKFEKAKLGAKTVVDAKIDDLCDGGSQFHGLTKADVSFDVGDVWMTPWVHSTADVSPFAGNGNVTLRFFTTDTGDSIYDTAVLFDKVEFE
jgi:hypothetical protein